MGKLILITTVLFSPVAFGQGMILGDLQAPVAAPTPANKPEPAPAVTTTVATPQPAPEPPPAPAAPVDEWASVRCSKGNYTNLAFNKTGMSAGDIIRRILNVQDPFNRPIRETEGASGAQRYKHKWGGEQFQMLNSNGVLTFSKGTLFGPVYLPAKVCLEDDNRTVIAVLDGSSVNKGQFRVNISALGADAIQVSGLDEGGKALQGTFTVR